MFRIRRSREQLSLVVAGIFVLLTFIVSLYNLNPDRPGREIPASEQLRRALQALQEAPAFTLSVEECAPGYCLMFHGKVEGTTRMTGYLEEFELEVMLEEDQLFVKRQGDNCWQTAEKLQLESLGSLLLNPLQILNLFNFDDEKITEGNKTTVNGISCRTFSLQVLEENVIRLLFPEVPLIAVQEVLLTTALAGGSLKKLTIHLELAGSGNKFIKRSCIID